ncbi:hypothetical protein EG240_15170 [Paenimyroides tangerinum]|uniref:Uncharacterized protein n=2 Tax=Paenimyroides tangerinum TaxID=2488728 RepID=A0A3P3VZ77_9FLAO|nr:hypothetical protein EG240_15170 [Paenimyroides tangerinum]
MKKMFVLFCISIYLISTTELSQLLKFPVLVEHYIEHKDKSPELTLIDFLEIHYNNHLEGHPYDEDYEQDQKLPFIAQADVLSVCFVFNPLITFEIKNKPFQSKRQKAISFDDAFLENSLLSSIWQPPEFV